MSHVEIEPLPPSFHGTIRDLFRGRETVWPRVEPDEVERFIASTGGHGIHPLLHERSRFLLDAPAEVVARFRESALIEAALDVLRTESLKTVLAALDADRIPALVFKGSALAWSHYASSALRPRADHDLLVHRGDLDRAGSAVESAGFRRATSLEGETVFAQHAFMGSLGGAVPFAIDLHWRPVNLEGVSRAIETEELFEGARPVRCGDFQLLAPRPVYAMVLASIHRAAHHFATDRLVWLYDLHLLFEGLGPDEESELWRLAREREVSGLCADALNRAADWFGTRPPGSGSWPLEVARGERASALLRPGRTRFDDFRFAWSSSSSWTWRMRYLREQLFPSKRYMVRRYGPSSGLVTRWRYLARIVRGAGGLFRRN